MAAAQPVPKDVEPGDAPAEPTTPAPPAPNWPDIAGGWETTSGAVNFTVTDVRDDSGAVVGKSAHANYMSDGGIGRVVGELQDLTLAGRWYEPVSARECDSERGGTRFWGRFEFEFNRAVNEFSGHWGYCEETLDQSWTGTRG